MQIEILRRRSDRERLHAATSLSAHVWQLASRAFAERFAGQPEETQQFLMLASVYGPELAARWRDARRARQ